MSRTVYGKFIFTNGVTEPCMSHEQAYEYCEQNNCYIEYAFSQAPIVGRRRDSFQAGYNPVLGEYVGGPREYTRKLKERGLVEIGNEKMKVDKPKPQGATDDMIKHAVDNGAKLSGQEISALKSGEKLHRSVD